MGATALGSPALSFARRSFTRTSPHSWRGPRPPNAARVGSAAPAGSPPWDRGRSREGQPALLLGPPDLRTQNKGTNLCLSILVGEPSQPKKETVKRALLDCWKGLVWISMRGEPEGTLGSLFILGPKALRSHVPNMSEKTPWMASKAPRPEREAGSIPGLASKPKASLKRGQTYTSHWWEGEPNEGTQQP